MSMIEWENREIADIDVAASERALLRQGQLTKPPGSLGELEDAVVRLAGMQGLECPACDNVHIAVFAADHGIAQQNVSAFPQEVTRQMILNFASGGAAITVLAKYFNAHFEVINLGTVTALEHPNVIDAVIAPGSLDFSVEEAMSAQQLEQAFKVGCEAVKRAEIKGADLFIAGEMGIANTTSASAIMAALLQLPGEKVAGPGTGVASEGVKHKARVIDQAINLHSNSLTSPLAILRCLGGFEIAAMVASYLCAAEKGITIVVDGFISTVAAYLAIQINQDVIKWMFFGHHSSEPFHRYMIELLNVKPLLDLGMRLGEGSGAAVSVSVLQLACELHRNMATFSDAGVSQ